MPHLISFNKQNHPNMFKNYIKIAWRNMTRNQSHSFINILGLAIGIACCLLIMLWVSDEMSYDTWNEKADRTYRLTNEINFGGSHRHFAVAPAPMAATLKSDFPEVESAVRFRTRGSSLVKREVQNFFEPNIVYCDSSVFEVFSLKMIQGNPNEALSLPNTMIISEKAAKKYFPNDSPLGKTLTFDDQAEYIVDGVIEDIPSNSHFNYDFFVSLSGDEEASNQMWVSNNFHTYYVLREGTNVAAFEAKVYPHILEKYMGPQIAQLMGQPFEEFEKSGAFVKYHFQALTDIHLKSDLDVELAANGNIQYIWIFSIAALFILLIACVNFMNLSTARSSIRAKEIGVRKVLGSMRQNLISQFLVESVLMASIALVLGLILAFFAIPYYNELTDKQLSLPFANISFWMMTLLGTLLVGLLAGSYPAFYLSAFQPIKTLSGKIVEKGSNLNLRNGLVVFQFFIAVFLIIGTLVINQQMDFIQHKKLGFDREQVLILDNVGPLRDKAFTLKKELLNHPNINTATMSSYLPIPSTRSDSPLCKNSQIQEDNCVAIQMWQVDEDYLSTFGMELVAGRNFSPEMQTDSNAIIINETAAKLLGYDDPINKKVYGSPNFNPEGGTIMASQTIIGVVKDFHYESLRQNIGAVSLWLSPRSGNISMKINTDDVGALIASIERTWKSVAPNQPFSYRFMDDSFDRIYRSESRISSIFSIFSALSIFIACLGLFSLAAFATERRTKEIGIRKVLGATTTHLVALLSKDFLKLVVISLLIAIPLAWYFMHYWLADFAYRVEIKWTVFVMAGVLAILIAFLTVSYQSIKAAMGNPIESLRSE